MSVVERHDFDLNLLAGNFTECGDYTKEVILHELEYWRGITDFLVLISGNIDGFLIGYRSRNSLWIAQAWRKAGTDIESSRKAMEMAKVWAKEHGMISVTGETDRTQMKAMERYGFKEEAVIMKASL